MIPLALYAYRTAPQDSLGDTPFYCLYGRDPISPLSLEIELAERENDERNPAKNYADLLAKNLIRVRKVVHTQLLKAQNKMARLKNLKKKDVSYQEGDSVWLYLPYWRTKTNDSDEREDIGAKKLTPRWHGPYRIIKRIGPNTYQLDIPERPNMYPVINVSRLKKFVGYESRPYEDDIPQLFDSDEESSDEESEISKEKQSLTSMLASAEPVPEAEL